MGVGEMDGTRAVYVRSRPPIGEDLQGNPEDQMNRLEGGIQILA